MNVVSKLFMTSARPSLAVDSDTTDEQGNTKPVPTFVTIQSLATFPGSAIAVTIVWRFFDSLLGIESQMVPIITAFLVGAALYWMSLRADLSRRDKVIGAGIAVLNAMYLALSVLGIDVGLGDAGVADQTEDPTP